jgi:predicted metalloprotease with PDZ domain
MTQYMGNVLAARSGLETPAQYREKLAASAANLDNKPGRQWRSTEDTAISASILRGGDPSWSNWKRGQDYYQEGELLWLDADTLIRKGTDNKKSLTDFQHIFLAKGGNTGPLIVPYDRAELIEDLNEVYKYDWANFLRDRVDVPTPHADLAGITAGGYELVYNEKPATAPREATAGRPGAGPDDWYSLGMRVRPDSVISDIRWGGPADKAKLAPGDKIIGINGNVATPDTDREAIRKAKTDPAPIHLIVQSDTFLRLVDIDYHGGERYPALKRIEGAPALLDDIIKPLTKPDPASLPKSRDPQSTPE